MTLTEKNKEINKFVYKKNRVHYIKWELDSENDWSIRFFFLFDTRGQYNKKWVLKSHKSKNYIVLSKKEAVEYIFMYARDKTPKEYFSFNNFKDGYRRIIISEEKDIENFLLKDKM